MNTALSRSFFAYDPARYAGYTVRSGPGAIPFTVPGTEGDLWGGSVRLTTPTWRQVSASASAGRSATPIFREAARGRSTRLDASVQLRPTPGLRTAFQVTRLTLDRSRDGSRFSTETIPRLKTEYQVSRALFFRFVGQYTARTRAALEDRAGRQILVHGAPDTGDARNEFRMDWLASYRPVPGTLVYLGYGSSMEEPDDFRFSDLRRTADGFFVKLSYLFRL